jgi:small-conductance mechanosensitive channel
MAALRVALARNAPYTSPAHAPSLTGLWLALAATVGLAALVLDVRWLPCPDDLSRDRFAAGVAWAADPAEKDPFGGDDALRLEMEGAPPTAPVVVDGKVLLRVRGISSFPAERRARQIAGRIAAIGANPAISLDSLRAVDEGGSSQILAGDRLILQVFDGDAAVEQVPRPLLVKQDLERVREAVLEYRADRAPGALAVRTAYAVAALLALSIGLFALRWVFRRLEALLERRYGAHVEDVRIQSFKLLDAEQLWAGLRAVLHAVRLLITLVATYAVVEFVLYLYPWTRGFAADLLYLILDPIEVIARGVVDALPGLVFIAILVMFTRWALGLLRLFFVGVDRGAVRIAGFEREWAWPTYKIVRLLAIAFTVVIAYPYIPGSDSAAFKGVSLFLGVVFSLGSSSIIANMIAGYAMTYRRAFRIGDRVQVGDVVGIVTDIRLQVTHLRSPKNEEVVVPNSLILNSHVVNYSSLARGHGLILHTNVGIGYETPWRQVEAMLLLAAERTPGLRHQPPPFVLQKSLDDFCVTYELNVYTDDPAAMPRTYSDLHRSILDVFNEYGVQIMTPAYERDTEQPKIVPREEWFAAPAQAPPEAAARETGRPAAAGGALPSGRDPGS